jgi:GMP synthase (glutamine-hydrolysing)
VTSLGLEATLPSVTAQDSWLAIQHVPFEGPGLIAAAAARRGIALEVAHVYRGQPLPLPDTLGGLVVMGGPMGVGDSAQHPHLLAERELIAAMVHAGRPVLGVCLGAQLLADALGARVYKGAQPEIGVGSVSLTPAGRRDPVLGAADLQQLPVMHWHQDTFELPGEASWLAHSVLYPHQGFRVGRRAYGLQFHVEVDRELASGWGEHLPAGVSIPEKDRLEIERAGELVLNAFFDLALDPRPDTPHDAGRG